MQKSCFSIYKDPLEDAVCIAIKHPSNYKGACYPDLFPNRDFLFRYFKDHDEDAYTKAYNEQILQRLNPHIVWEELKNKTIICWELEGIFCHRNIVAEWLEKAINVIIPEWTPCKFNNQQFLFKL